MNSQWKTDIMQVSNNDLWRAYRATGAVTECGPYERNYAQRGNDRLDLTGPRPEMDRGQRGIAAADGSHKMDPVQRWIAARYVSRPDMDG